MDNFGNLRVIGERPLDAGGLRWSRFQTEHPIPQSCDVRGVRARFDNSILYITFPKLITEEPKPTVAPTPTPKPEPEPMPEPEKKPPMPDQKKVAESKKDKEEEVKKKEEKEERDDDHHHGEKEKEERDADHHHGEKEKEERDAGHSEKEQNDGVETVVAPAPEKMGIGFFKGIRRPRQVVVNMFVAVIVIVVIGIYLGYKLRRLGWGARGE